MLKKTKDFRLAEWKKILTEANSSGMSKRAWCKANGINERKLYYWQHRIWQTESTGSHLPAEHNLPVRDSGSLLRSAFLLVILL
jgi:putative transposase